MGGGLADEILQGDAGPAEFRTAPLWGLGAADLLPSRRAHHRSVGAIEAHQSSGTSRYAPSEANSVVDRYNQMRESDKQDLMNFLRSL
jgi:CxxC motif-containing protein (DUF1111 family)